MELFPPPQHVEDDAARLRRLLLPAALHLHRPDLVRRAHGRGGSRSRLLVQRRDCLSSPRGRVGYSNPRPPPPPLPRGGRGGGRGGGGGGGGGGKGRIVMRPRRVLRRMQHRLLVAVDDDDLI